MGTKNISLPEELEAYVDAKVASASTLTQARLCEKACGS